MKQHSVTLILIITFQVVTRVKLQRIQSRHFRPYQDGCERSGRCSSKDGYADVTDQQDAKKASEQERPAGSTLDDFPPLIGINRHGTDDYKPKPAYISDNYEPKEEGTPGFNTKPLSFEHKSVEEDLKPAHGLGSGSIPNHGRDDYSSKLDRDELYHREDYKPDIRPKPPRSGGYFPKPADRPVRGGGQYDPKAADDKLDNSPRPVTGAGQNSRPKVDRPEYLSRPTGVYNPKLRDDPEIESGGYNTSPVRDNPRYVHQPIGNGGYKLKPADDVPKFGGGGYNPNPEKDNIDNLPDSVGSGGYKLNSDDIPKIGSGGYNPNPSKENQDYVPKPIGNGGYRPKEDVPKPGGLDERYIPKPIEYNKPETSGYRPNPGSKDAHRKPDHGGYEIPKVDDYNYDYSTSEGGNVDMSSLDEKPKPQVDGNCICVPYYQCEDGHIVTDGAGIIDARKRPEPEEDLPLDGKFKPPSCGPFHVCCNTPESSTVKPYEHRCGVRNPSGINSRILSPSNKGEADFGEWPWQAAVLKSEGKVNIFQCGGVLIDKFHVLTVAHCVFHLHQYNEYPLKVRLGEWDTQTTNEFLAHEDYTVNKIFIHPEYKNTSLWNDVAILRLEEGVLFAPHIDTVCLPQYDEIFAEQNCVVTGWGKDAYKGGTFSNVMKEVAIQVIDNYKCEEMLRKTRLGRFFQLHEGFLCAGGEYGLDSCKGDGGGPLVCYRKDKSYALAGIVSWGIDCGQPGVPGVYVKIQKFLDWISKSTGVSLQEYWPKRS